MTKRRIVGELEQLVLMAVFRLREEAFGMAVWREIESRAGASFPVGSVYMALDRLQEKGYLRSKSGEVETGRGVEERLKFKITGVGQSALAEALRRSDAMRRGLPGLKGVPAR